MARSKKRGHPPQDDDDDDVDVENRENGSYEDHHDDEDEEENDAEEEEDDDDRRSRRRKKKKKHGHHAPKIMSASGQTEADRRVLRRRQRELHDDIAMGGNGADAEAENGDNDDAGGADGLARLREQNNALWKEVHYTREAVLDSENVDLIAGKAAREAEKLVQVPRYDAVRLAQSLVKKGAVRIGPTSQFNWRGLGFQVGVCFNAPPCDVSFLYGPLDAEYAPKERKKPERRKKAVVEEEAGEEEEPEDVDQTGKKKSDGNELSAVEKHISVIKHALKERSEDQKEAALVRAKDYEKELEREIDDPTVLLKKKKEFVRENAQVDAVNCLFNPKSFTQTVENVFHFSFLVKEGRAGIRVRGVERAEELGLRAPGPALRTVRDGDELPPPRQAIVSLNMRDWRDMCRAYEVEESDVPHRVDGKVAKKEKRGRKSDG